MITATPPPYYQQIDLEFSSRPIGASDDSTRIDEYSMHAIRHLTSTPRHTIESSDELNDYKAPELRRIGAKRVRLNYRGTMPPLPIAEDLDL